MIGLVAVAALTTTANAAVAQSRAEVPRAEVNRPGVGPSSITSNLATVERQSPAQTQSQQRRGLQWNESGRWALNLDLTQPVGREADWSDVEAAAYYRLNPRLRVGAAASLAEPQADPARPAETDRRAQPRVRLETIFRF